ncbi:hypothetical protein HKD37_07G019846 [Glycine soja]
MMGVRVEDDDDHKGETLDPENESCYCKEMRYSMNNNDSRFRHSKSSPTPLSGKDQKNWWTRFANTISIIIVVNLTAGQPLLPAPNSISSKSCPLKSIELFRNLYGLNTREDTTSNVFIKQIFIQTQLQDVCWSLNIPQPMYKLHDTKVINRFQYHRYHGYIKVMCTGPLQYACFSKYGKNDYKAMKDVANILLNKLLKAYGKKIRDFNYYNVQNIESQLRMYGDHDGTFKVEMNMLNDEMQSLNSSKGFTHGMTSTCIVYFVIPFSPLYGPLAHDRYEIAELKVQIILFMALKVMKNELSRPNKTIWCLPPTLVVSY